MENIRSILKKIFTLDLRSLAIYRIITGLVLMYDLINRSLNLASHYTSDGIYPISYLKSSYNNWYLSFQTISDSFVLQAVLFGITFLFAVAFTLGYKTKLVSIVTWVLLYSMHTRNPLLNFGADTALLVGMFWTMFLPLGEYWSIDCKNKKKETTIFNIASIALVIQVFSIFVFTGLYKLKFELWSSSFRAIEYALSDLGYVTPIGDLLLNLPTPFFKLLTAIIPYAEIGLPILFCLGFTHYRFKLISIYGLLIILFGFGISLFIGIFPCTVAALLLALLPPQIWNKRANSFEPSVSSGNPFIQFGLGLLMLLTLAFNISYIKQIFPFPQKIKNGLGIIGLTQYWTMFAPPSTYTRWPIVKATYKNGFVKNLLYPDEIYSDKRPERFGSKIWNERWQAYYANISRQEHFESLTNYFIKTFDADSNQIEKLEIMYLYQNIQLDSVNRYGETYKYVFSSYNCSTKEFQSFENGKLN